MSRLWGSVKRIWQALRRITSSAARRITGGASSTVRAVGAGIGVIAAFLVMLCILVLIAVVAVPYGIFGKDSKTSTSDNASSPQVQFCEACGVADIDLIEVGDKHVCIACKDDLNKQEKADVAEAEDKASEPIPQA